MPKTKPCRPASLAALIAAVPVPVPTSKTSCPSTILAKGNKVIYESVEYRDPMNLPRFRILIPEVLRNFVCPPQRHSHGNTPRENSLKMHVLDLTLPRRAFRKQSKLFRRTQTDETSVGRKRKRGERNGFGRLV